MPTESCKYSKALGYGLLHGSRGPYFLERMLTIDRIVSNVARASLAKAQSTAGVEGG